jgi:hypothetical protein
VVPNGQEVGWTPETVWTLKNWFPFAVVGINYWISGLLVCTQLGDNRLTFQHWFLFIKPLHIGLKHWLCKTHWHVIIMLCIHSHFNACYCYDGTLPTSHYRHPQTRPNMAIKIVITSCISVIYCLFYVVTFNISVLIHTRCKEPTFERVSVTVKTKSNVNWRRRQKVKHSTFTCSSGVYHYHKNTSMYELHLTRSLSKYDTLFQHDCYDEINISKFVRLAPLTFLLVSWFKTAAHVARHHGWLHPPPPFHWIDTWRGKTEVARILPWG